MWLWQNFRIVFLISLSQCQSIVLHNAPDHSYKSTDYSFSYGVKDMHTGDVKHQWEKKNDGVVRGHYSVVEPDGLVRIVDYTADGKSGFNAVVKRLPTKEISYQHPPNTHFTSLKESVKKEYQFDDADNEIKQYIFLPQEDEDKEESQKNKIKIPYYQNYQNKILTSIPKLPIDINVVKESAEKIIPIDITRLAPIEIDLSQIKSHKNPVRELSTKELQKFLKEYYSSYSDKFHLNQPKYEGGFQPINPVKNQIAPKITAAQMLKPKKRPVTTPGLKNYASVNTVRFREHVRPHSGTRIRKN